MKSKYIILQILVLFFAFRSFAQENDIETISNELAGEYEFYIEQELLYINFKLWKKDGTLMCQDQYMHDAAEITPVKDEKLKYRMNRMGSIQYLQFYRDSANNISKAKFIATKKLEFWGNKLNSQSDAYTITNKIFSVDVLNDELIQVKNILLKSHPAPYKFTGKKEFNELFNEQMAKIDHPMGVREFYVISAPLVEAISCGHTYLELPDHFWTKSNRRSFPIELIFIDKKAYVNSFFKEEIVIPVGSEIVSINDKKIDDFVHSAMQIISSDGNNETWKISRLNSDFAEFYTILYGASDTYKVEYIEPGTGSTKTKILPCIQTNQLIPYAKNTSTGNPNLDFELDKVNNLAVITILDNNYYEGIEEFKTFIDNCFIKINNNAIDNLIIDVRDNTGGDPVSAAYLLSYIEKEPVPYLKNINKIDQYSHLYNPVPMAESNVFNGNLFVLIDGGCFSTTGHLCSLLKYNNIGTFIGEETGGTYECNDSHYAHNTKETRLNVNVAHLTFATAVKGLSREHGILPDYPVKPNIKDVIDGKDTIREFANNLIDNNAGSDM